MIIEKIKIYKNMQGLYNTFGNTPFANLKMRFQQSLLKLRQESRVGNKLVVLMPSFLIHDTKPLRLNKRLQRPILSR